MSGRLSPHASGACMVSACAVTTPQTAAYTLVWQRDAVPIAHAQTLHCCLQGTMGTRMWRMP